MDASGDNSFEQACQGLERISRLKESNLLEDAEYQELRALLLAQMKRFVSPAETSHTTGPQLTLPPTPSVAYGQLHAAIVEVIEERYKGAKGQAKQRIFRALADMADKQALYPGDSYELERLIELVYAPVDGSLGQQPADAAYALLKTVVQINDASTKIRDAELRSPAAKAMAGTAQQSANQVAEELASRQAQPTAEIIKQRWMKVVLKDVEGALEGGAAAVTAFPALSLAAPWGLPVAAAFGVLIGGGVQSGIARSEG